MLDGFGLLGEQGGQYGGPIGIARARDPRFAMANALTAKALDTSEPVRTRMQGFGKLAEAGVAAILQNRLESEYKNRDADYTRAIANALSAGQGSPAETKTYTTPEGYQAADGSDMQAGAPLSINWAPKAPDPQQMTNILASNRDTAPMAMQMQMQQIAAQQKAQIDYVNDLRGKGLMPGPGGAVIPIPGYGSGVGSIAADTSRAQIPVKVDEANALIAPKVTEQNALTPGVISRAGGVAGAQAAAELPYAGPKAAAIEGAQMGVKNAPTQIVLPGQAAPITVPAASVAPIITKYGEQGATQGQQNVTTEGKLADDFRSEPAVKAYQSVVPIYNSMVDAAPKNTRASDLNLVYGLGKIMDPTSVVREGEMVMVNNTAALPDWLVGQINRVNGGAGLTPETRNAILAEASSRAQNYKAQFDTTADQYSQKAGRYGLKPENIVIRPTALTEFKPMGTDDPVAAEMKRRGLLK